MRFLMVLPYIEILVYREVTNVKWDVLDDAQWFLPASICKSDIIMCWDKIVELQMILELSCHEVDASAAINENLCDGCATYGCMDKRGDFGG